MHVCPNINNLEELPNNENSNVLHDETKDIF